MASTVEATVLVMMSAVREVGRTAGLMGAGGSEVDVVEVLLGGGAVVVLVVDVVDVVVVAAAEGVVVVVVVVVVVLEVLGVTMTRVCTMTVVVEALTHPTSPLQTYPGMQQPPP